MPGITVFGQIAIVVGSLFVGLHYTLIQCTQPAWGDFIIASLCAVTALGYALIKAPRNRLTRLLVRTAFLWSGVAFLAGLAFAGQFVLAQAGFLIGDGTAWLSALVLGGVGFLRARHPRPRYRRVEGEYEQPLRLLQLTDMHVGDIWSKNDLARIVRKTRHYRPDAVVITGDLLDGMEPVEPELVAPLQQFDVPVYFVSGNHDSYTERAALLDALRDLGAVPLEGAVHETEAMSLLGVGYETTDDRRDELVEAFRETKRPRVVLKHKPEGLEGLLAATPDAILCGHVHNGQVWPLGLLAYLEFPQVEGTRWYDQTMVHVSQGSATWGPPFRLGTRSEFTIIDFVPE
ncbi:MAG: metallophosphoesterase [Salinibacter sp.]